MANSFRSDGLPGPESARIAAAFARAASPPDAAADGYAWLDDGRSPEGESRVTPAAVLVPLIGRSDGVTVLLTKRTAHLTSHAGQVSFPGGRAEADDATPEDTALRETEEELGLPRRQVRLIGRLNVRETGTGYRVAPVVGLVAPPLRLDPDPEEVAEVFEVPLAVVADRSNYRLETRVQRGATRRFYALPYDGFYIWGLTARLLVNLADVLKHR